MANMTYASTGVDYDAMDPFKRAATAAGRETAQNIRRLNGGVFRELELSRGESCYLIETIDSYFAHVEEGLGTKNLVADAMYALMLMRSYYDFIAQDVVAMIVNDMITLGALPLSVAMHLAVGDGAWFDDEKRCQDLINGWKHACNLAGCVWGGGETPTLRGIIISGTAVISGSAMGVIEPKHRRITGNIQGGDAIVLVESSGIHANGLTMARRIADKLPDGYLTKLSDGRTYGDTLLDPTRIYVGLVEQCLDLNVKIHYAVNITGHGWRKLMRATKPFAYIIDELPKQLPIFDFIQEHGPVDDREAYGNFNMGAGFALYVPEADVGSVVVIAKQLGLRAFKAGHIEESAEKKVIIKPKGIEYSAATLAVR